MSLVGSGYACRAHEGHAAHMAMGDMPMAEMPMDMPMDMADHGSGDRADSSSDCSFPWSLGGCESMASCAPSAVVVDAAILSPFAALEHDAPAFRADHLRSVSRSPELPPPRA